MKKKTASLPDVNSDKTKTKTNHTLYVLFSSTSLNKLQVIGRNSDILATLTYFEKRMKSPLEDHVCLEAHQAGSLLKTLLQCLMDLEIEN